MENERMTLEDFLRMWHDGQPELTVFTSGSTGKPKKMRVEKERMVNSARMTLSFLGLERGQTALLCMPLDFIAGKMMVVRAEVGGLRLISVPPSGHPMSHPETASQPVDFAAMVPLQVYNSLQVEEERRRLMNVRHLIIGGGAVDTLLARQLHSFPHAVWSTYGMTETLSHIAMRRISGPEASEWYSPLPGVRVWTNEEDCLVVDAPAVSHEQIVTNDIVEMHSDGRRFKVRGRKDHVICCGGVKIQAEEVERLLEPYLSQPFLITKAKDEKFGEIPVMMVEGEPVSTLKEIFDNVLPKYWIPKKVVCVRQLPRTATGKPKRI